MKTWIRLENENHFFRHHLLEVWCGMFIFRLNIFLHLHIMLLEHPIPAIGGWFDGKYSEKNVIQFWTLSQISKWHCASPLIWLAFHFSFWSRKRELLFLRIVPSHHENKHIKNVRFMNTIVRKRKGEGHDRIWAECSDFGWGMLAYSGAVLHGDAYTIFKAIFSTGTFVQSPSKLLHLTHHGTCVPVLSAVAWTLHFPHRLVLLLSGAGPMHISVCRGTSSYLGLAIISHQLFWQQSCSCNYLGTQ